MKERVRLVVEMLLIRPLPPHVAAGAPARVRRVRVMTWLAYVDLACALVSLVTAALGDNGTPWWVQGLHWLSAAGLLVVTACLFAAIFNVRRGIRPGRPLRR
jgi:hypothetical protein